MPRAKWTGFQFDEVLTKFWLSFDLSTSNSRWLVSKYNFIRTTIKPDYVYNSTQHIIYSFFFKFWIHFWIFCGSHFFFLSLCPTKREGVSVFRRRKTKMNKKEKQQCDQIWKTNKMLFTIPAQTFDFVKNTELTKSQMKRQSSWWTSCLCLGIFVLEK
jgi:hypothetical protein